jgi:CRISPR-associated endonuclease/helicase Cas3
MFTIRAHGIPHLAKDEAGISLSAAQERLIQEDRPIRICGAPTGAGKTFAFLQAARKGKTVLFVAPTQALARDIEMDAIRWGVPVHRWDGAQSRALREQGLEPWEERKRQWDGVASSGGMVVTTPETLGAVLLGDPRWRRVPLDAFDVLHAGHVVFDEAHTLGARALGFLHCWAMLAVYWHRQDPQRGFKLTLLSATHSNLFHALWNDGADGGSAVPIDAVACFDEQVENGHREGLRMLHGDVRVETVAGDILECVDLHAAGPLKRGERLLILYDSLRALADQEPQLQQRLAGFGVDPRDCFLVTGQDRKGGGFSLGGTGFEAGLCPEDRHRVVIATSCIEAGVNLDGLRHAILDPGLDAASLLQRIGRVARKDQAGQAWIATPNGGGSTS